MAVVHEPETAAGKELAKFEQHHTKFTSDTVPPGNPYTFREYGTSGKMLYKAQYHPLQKKMACMVGPPNLMDAANQAEHDRAERFVDQFNRSCSCIVRSDDEKRAKMNEGWRESPVAALEAAEASRKATANITASRHFSDRSMSANAQAEAAAADASTDDHLGEVPQTPKRRGRKPKAPMIQVPAMPEGE